MAVNVCFRTKAGQSSEKSIFGSFCLRILFVYLFIGCWVCADAGASECTNVKFELMEKKLVHLMDFTPDLSRDSGGLCLNSGCCGPKAKSTLVPHAKAQLEKLLRMHVTKLADVLSSKAVQVNDFFKKLLQHSKSEFRDMFKKTYGIIYEQHSYVFEDLFTRLEEYYATGRINLTSTMKYFFSVLFERMFVVLNSQYEYDPKYLSCVKEHMHTTKPFADVPDKLSVQLNRALVATRTFYVALDKASQIVRSISKAKLSDECVEMWTRMQYCGVCGSLKPDELNLQPCARYCQNVLRGCLHYHADLDEEYDAFVDAIDKVADRLQGPFNIVMVVEPIDIKISEAIMHFQEHNTEISKSIINDCGKPELNANNGGRPFFQERSRRSPRMIPDFDWNQTPDDDFVVETSFENVLNEDPSLLQMKEMPDIVEKMKEQARYRRRFLRYMRGEIAEDEYDDEDEKERRKRDADSMKSGLPYALFVDGNKKKGKKTVAARDDWAAKNLDRIVRDSRNKVRSSRDYWERLPYLLCGDITKTPGTPECFNGTHFASYTRSAASPGTAGLASNPEVTKMNAKEWSFSKEREQLKMLTANLRDAYNGHEVTWAEDTAEDRSSRVSSMPTYDDEDLNGSGSGVGESDDEDYDTTPYHNSGDGPPRTLTESEPYDSMEEVDSEDTDDEIPETTIAPTKPHHSYDPILIHGDTNENVIEPENPSEERVEVEYKPPVNVEPEKPQTGKANSPSVQKALFMYAMPVMCAWFGTMVTDLF